MENIPQTAAAGTGFSLLSNKLPVPNGFIGAFNRCSIYQLPGVGDTIRTEVKVKTISGNATLAHSIINRKEDTIASTEITIFIVDTKNL
jgi:hypothetical protein